MSLLNCEAIPRPAMDLPVDKSVFELRTAELRLEFQNGLKEVEERISKRFCASHGKENFLMGECIKLPDHNIRLDRDAASWHIKNGGVLLEVALLKENVADLRAKLETPQLSPLISPQLSPRPRSPSSNGFIDLRKRIDAVSRQLKSNSIRDEIEMLKNDMAELKAKVDSFDVMAWELPASAVLPDSFDALERRMLVLENLRSEVCSNLEEHAGLACIRNLEGRVLALEDSKVNVSNAAEAARREVDCIISDLCDEGMPSSCPMDPPLSNTLSEMWPCSQKLPSAMEEEVEKRLAQLVEDIRRELKEELHSSPAISNLYHQVLELTTSVSFIKSSMSYFAGTDLDDACASQLGKGKQGVMNTEHLSVE